ncbi:hypothetical protein GCK72_004647 [Caenorhabditis remanei]|uniref:CUB-like domain-containing protein n=1 Tax=Caenorhabditis remanei TaxID=31234 RepID=A0A6A5HBZ7_CAERE|nr:hypothetical protein GCK72_004647 [Caenorhabditis remanei]KAF1764697.1 hypothetical protein GCK72_004647 [Caenorhabditis remanei]
MLILLLSFFLLFQLSHSQLVIPLNSLKGDNFKNLISSTSPYSLYVSANEDSTEILKQIFVQGKNLDEIRDSKNSKSTGFLLSPLKIQSSSAYISSSLPDYQLASLKGFVYVTTTKQANDDSFLVYDVAQSQAIRTNHTGNYTIVFLNTNPTYSSTISNWTQGSSSTAKMYRGYPTDLQEGNFLFANPVEPVSKELKLFPAVEKFSVRFPLFYFKITNYLLFQIESGSFALDGYSTTGYDSTGFYMKPRNEKPKNFTITCMKDDRYNGSTGILMSGSNLRTDATLRIQFNAPDDSSFSIIEIADIRIPGFAVNMIYSSLTISSNNTDDGEVYVQYYILQDQFVGTTRPVQQTTMIPVTTTKGSNRGYAVWVLIMFLCMIF